MQLFIKQKLISIRDKYFIKDEQGNDVFEVKSSFFKIPRRFTVKDMQDNEIMMLKNTLFHPFFPRYRIFKGEEEVGLIRERFEIGRRTYSIEMNDGRVYAIKGNLRAWDFTIIKGDKPACYISKKILSFGDSYALDIYDDADMEVAVATAIVMDALNHDNRNGGNRR